MFLHRHICMDVIIKVWAKVIGFFLALHCNCKRSTTISNQQQMSQHKKMFCQNLTQTHTRFAFTRKQTYEDKPDTRGTNERQTRVCSKKKNKHKTSKINRYLLRHMNLGHKGRSRSRFYITHESEKLSNHWLFHSNPFSNRQMPVNCMTFSSSIAIHSHFLLWIVSVNPITCTHVTVCFCLYIEIDDAKIDESAIHFSLLNF